MADSRERVGPRADCDPIGPQACRERIGRRPGREKIGVLALQGCVVPHREHVEALGADFVEVRDEEALFSVDRLILPGGESPTIIRLLHRFGLWEPLRQRAGEIPVWGICAGAILLASEVEPEQPSLGLLDCRVARNAYGRQIFSREIEVAGYPVCLIRAPRLTRVGAGVEVVARAGGEPLWIRSGRVMATSFHPELTRIFPSPMHRAFVEMGADRTVPRERRVVGRPAVAESN